MTSSSNPIQSNPTYVSGYLNDLRAVAAGLCIAFRPRQCTEANSSVVVCACCACTDLPQKTWAVSSRTRNALQHILNGNGAGSRATARRRKQKQSNAQANGFNLQQVGEILKLLTQLCQLLGIGGGSGKLFQQLSTLMGQEIGAVDTSKNKGGNKPKKRKKERKTQEGDNGGAGLGHRNAALNSAPITNPTSTSAQLPNRKQDANKKQPTQASKSFVEVVRTNAPFKPVWCLRQSDWTGQVLTFDSFCSALDQPGNVSATAQCESEEQLSELKVLTEGDATDQTRELHVSAVLLAPKEAKQIDGRQLRLIPGKIAGKVQPRQAYLIALKGNGPTLKRAAVVSAAPAAQTETVVVRLSVEAKYLLSKEWQSIQAKPKASAQSWLRRHVPAHIGAKVFDMWAFQEECTKGGGKPVITGLLRIEKDAAKGLLSCSGKSLWFVEPLQWNNSVVESCDVEWIKKGPDLDGPSYLQKVRSLAGDLGIARGWGGLGVRKPRASDPIPKPRAWRISGVPREWSASTVTEAITRAGLQDPKILSRKTLGKQVEWWAHANAQRDLDFLEIQAGEHTIVVVEAPRQRPQRPITKKLSSYGKVNFHSNTGPATVQSSQPPLKSFYIGTPLKEKNAAAAPATGATQPGDVQADEAMKAASAAAGDKREPSSPAKLPAAKRVAVDVKPPHGLIARTIAADGNCLFESISQGIGGKTARSVRAAVVNHLKKHEGRYKPWWDEREPTEQEEKCESWEKYMEMLAKVGAWGSSLECAAAAVHYDRPILVFQPTGVPEVYNSQGKAGGAIALWYRRKHYELLDGALPPGILEQAATGPMQGNRGGGSETGTHSAGATRLSALPSVAGAKKRSKRDASLPGSTCSERRRNPSPATATSGRERRAVSSAGVSEKDEAGSTSSKRPKREEWNCPLCDYSTGVHRLWPQKKQAHINAWHPDEKERSKLTPAMGQLCHAAPGMSFKWKCHLCNMVIPEDADLSRDQVLRMKLRHREEHHPKANVQRFKSDGSYRAANAAKATIQVRAAGMAKRLLGLKKGDAGSHEPVLVTLPMTGKAKQKRGGMAKVICRKCGKMANQAKELATLSCEKYVADNGPKRKKMLARLRACLNKASISDALKDGARTVLNIIDSGKGSSKDTAPKHHIEALVWPVDFTVRFACTRCKRCMKDEKHFRGMSCANSTVWNQKRKGNKDALLELANKEPGARQRAALRALEILGFQQEEGDSTDQ